MKNRPWEDMLFSIGGVVFFLSLLPSVFSDAKPSVGTSLPTALFLYLFLSVYVKHKWWFTFATTVCSATLWLILFFQVV